jgi:hypothetical protein
VATSTSKKVLVQRFDRETIAGFVNAAAFLAREGIEILTTSGAVSVLPYGDVKSVFFVRDFTENDPAAARRSFLSRPKLDGIWLRLHFRDGDSLEGLMPNNLLQFEAEGVHVIPPDGAQRVFVPRVALTSVQVLGVVGSPLRRGRKKPATRDQIGLFEETA